MPAAALYYDSSDPIRHRPEPGPHRALGVAVYGPSFHYGRGRYGFDVHYQLAWVNGDARGDTVDAEGIEEVIDTCNRKVLDSIDAAIAELERHRARIAAEVESEGDGLPKFWNDHKNDLGDWCPHSEKPVHADHGGDLCPAGCRASRREATRSSSRSPRSAATANQRKS